MYIDAFAGAGVHQLKATGAVGHPAYVTTTVADLTGAPARSFHDWVAAHADIFRDAGGQGDSKETASKV